MKDIKVLIIGFIIFIFALLFFLFIRNDKIEFSNDKLKESFIKIYDNEDISILSRYLKIKYTTSKDIEYTLEEALNNKIVSIENILSKSVKKEQLDSKTKVYYFDENSKIRSNTNFKIIVCNNKLIYFLEYDDDNNICNKTN